MPGVQDNYSIDVTNRFGFAGIDVDSGSDDGIENVDPFAMINDLKKQAETAKKAPKQKVNKKKVVAAEKPAQPEKKETGEGEKKQVPGNRGERGARRGGGRGDGRPRGDRPPREQRQGTDVDGAPREDRPRRGGGGGRGGAGGGRGPPRGERRTFDRKSGDPRTSVKGTDKREGAGSGNWGTPEDDLKAQTETVEEKPSEEKVEGKTEEKAAAEEAKPEPEEKTMTLEEYRKQKRSVQRNPNAKTASEPSANKKAQVGQKEREKKGRAARVEAVDFVAAPLVQRGPRGDRRGPREGGRRERQPRKDAPQTNALDLNGEEFPSLG